KNLNFLILQKNNQLTKSLKALPGQSILNHNKISINKNRNLESIANMNKNKTSNSSKILTSFTNFTLLNSKLDKNSTIIK
ncbi:hypothetical protein, partial [Flavobacterium sp.]|uniref:hypothetical protein n=1 Tax=Flavobacterium sp. TaxID=239 RepID=UPI00286E1DD9